MTNDAQHHSPVWLELKGRASVIRARHRDRLLLMVSRVPALGKRVRTLVSHPRMGIGIARRSDPVKRVLIAFAQDTAGHPVTFVQIGFTDGTTGDPLRAFTKAHGWSGVLVEPVPYVFSRLKQGRGSNPRLRFENAAISDHDGEVDFFHLRQRRIGEELPGWYDQLGSFSLETILTHEEEIPGIRNMLLTTTVRNADFRVAAQEARHRRARSSAHRRGGLRLGDSAPDRARALPTLGGDLRARIPDARGPA